MTYVYTQPWQKCSVICKKSYICKIICEKSYICKHIWARVLRSQHHTHFPNSALFTNSAHFPKSALFMYEICIYTYMTLSIWLFIYVIYVHIQLWLYRCDIKHDSIWFCVHECARIHKYDFICGFINVIWIWHYICNINMTLCMWLVIYMRLFIYVTYVYIHTWLYRFDINMILYDLCVRACSYTWVWLCVYDSINVIWIWLYICDTNMTLWMWHKHDFICDVINVI